MIPLKDHAFLSAWMRQSTYGDAYVDRSNVSFSVHLAFQFHKVALRPALACGHFVQENGHALNGKEQWSLRKLRLA